MGAGDSRTSFAKDRGSQSQVPFADDLRKYAFRSFDTLVSSKGDNLSEHPYLATQPQLDAMDKFVEEMDLMQMGEKSEDGYDMSSTV